MHIPLKFTKLSLATAALLFIPTLTFAQHYTQKNLVTDPSSGIKNVPTDVHLCNPWGLTRSPSSPWWVADNNSGANNCNQSAGVSTIYNGNTGAAASLVVTIPPPNGSSSASAPTGVVWNGSSDFRLKSNNNPAVFIFVTEDGTISGWNGGTNAVLEVDNSQIPTPNDGAVYKGVTIGDVDPGTHSRIPPGRYLYAANFRHGQIEIYDTTFTRVFPSADDKDRGRRDREEIFDDDEIPRGFAPFNVQSVGKNLVVTYALQNAARHDDVAGPGLGYVDVFSTSGKLLARLQHGDWLNSPWGVALAPRDFGEFSHALLIGNFGGGEIAAYNPLTGRFLGLLKNPDDTTLIVDGLWALAFGNSASAGPYNALFFTAGINGEADGLFGTLTPVATEQDGDEQ